MEVTSSYNVLLLFLFFVPIILSLLNQRKRWNLPPSPPSLPLIGHLHLMKEPFHRTFESLADRHGPVICLSAGTVTMVVVSSPSAVEECFTKNDVILANRPLNAAGKHIAYNYTMLGAASYGPHWKTLRRVTSTEILSATRLSNFIGIRREEVRQFIKGLYKEVSGKGLVRVEMRPRLQAHSFNIIMQMTSGRRYFKVEESENNKEVEFFMETITKIFELSGLSEPSDFLPVLSWLTRNRKERKIIKVHEEVDEVLQNLVDEHKKGLWENPDRKTMIDYMLSMQESDSQLFSDIVIKGQILTMLSAGTDTSAATIEWAMSLLLNNPEIMNKARAEIDRVVGPDRLADESDIENLPYLQCIIKEAHRMFPPAPLLIPHRASEDCTIGGFLVPRESAVVINIWKIHRDPKVWDDPLAFKPERHEGVEGDEKMTYKLIPFGHGRRSCPGGGLAKKVVFCALAGMIQCFEWETVTKEPVDLRERTGLTMPKLVPLEAMCRARESRVATVLANLL